MTDGKISTKPPLPPRRKTGKREIASLGLLYAGAMGVAYVAGYPEAIKVLELVIVPATAMAAAAFGAAEYSKNILPQKQDDEEDRG